MTLYVLAEEPSIQPVLERMITSVAPTITTEIRWFQGKHELEHLLQGITLSISKKPHSAILVTRDQDEEDCKLLKQRLLGKMRHRTSNSRVRIVCRELEAWFLGDLQAIEMAYPRSKATKYRNKSELRNVDTLPHPSQYLKKIIPDFAKLPYLPKREVAQKIAPYLNLERNKSVSFSWTVKAIQQLAV
jgi:hypothetical protein